MLEHGQAPKPFGADVVVALLELNTAAVMPVVHRGEVKKEADVKRLANGAELLEQYVVEASEVLVIERLDDRVSQHDGTCDDGISGRIAALQEHFVEDAE